jgi:hypothetical protein
VELYTGKVRWYNMGKNVDLEEEEALQKLSDDQLETLNNTLERFIQDPNMLERRLLIIENLDELNYYLPKVKYGYYGQFPKLLKETAKLLNSIYIMTKGDSDLNKLILDSIKNIKNCFSKIGAEYPDYQYYPIYYKYKATRPYGYQKATVENTMPDEGDVLRELITNPKAWEPTKLEYDLKIKDLFTQSCQDVRRKYGLPKKTELELSRDRDRDQWAWLDKWLQFEKEKHRERTGTKIYEELSGGV